MAEISQSMLKSSSEQERMFFAERVLSFINPKFDDIADFEASKSELLDFASKCELTHNEFIHALELATEGKLITEDENGSFSRVKMFREIDRLKLGEIKSAYIFYKRQDKKYENGKEIITAYLNPPVEIILTEEQKAELRLKTFKTEYKRLQRDGKVLDCFTFYNIIIESEKIENIKLSFVEKVLNKYMIHNEKSQNKSLFHNIVGSNPILFLKEEIVSAYIKKNKLREMNEDEWIDFWINKYESASGEGGVSQV